MSASKTGNAANERPSAREAGRRLLKAVLVPEKGKGKPEVAPVSGQPGSGKRVVRSIRYKIDRDSGDPQRKRVVTVLFKGEFRRFSRKQGKPWDIRMAEEIRRGLSVRTVPELMSFLGIKEDRVLHIIGLNKRTYQRRKAENRPLDPEQSDKAFRLARIGSRAEEIFGDSESANAWLKAPNRALGGQVPVDLLDTDAGTEAVEEVLTRIEYGVYS